MSFVRGNGLTRIGGLGGFGGYLAPSSEDNVLTQRLSALGGPPRPKIMFGMAREKKAPANDYERLKDDKAYRRVFFILNTDWRGDGWGVDQYGYPIHEDDYGKYSEFGWSIDHILPSSRGGSDNWDNLRPLQWYANCLRGAG